MVTKQKELVGTCPSLNDCITSCMNLNLEKKLFIIESDANDVATIKNHPQEFLKGYVAAASVLTAMRASGNEDVKKEAASLSSQFQSGFVRFELEKELGGYVMVFPSMEGGGYGVSAAFSLNADNTLTVGSVFLTNEKKEITKQFNALDVKSPTLAICAEKVNGKKSPLKSDEDGAILILSSVLAALQASQRKDMQDFAQEHARDICMGHVLYGFSTSSERKDNYRITFNQGEGGDVTVVRYETGEKNVVNAQGVYLFSPSDAIKKK
ncbi:MAG: hypothetical protein NTX79_01400 [Candidatus Micrarchaeota archaeon]|nr:hypothetical protein [Candidatus Micrarchaeota archaeon]